MEPTSEQELKELFDEGKISEEEYQQLLEALQQKQISQSTLPAIPPNPKPATGYGKTALILMIVAVLLPFAGIALSVFFHWTGIRMGVMLLVLLLLLGLLCGLFAFIFGIIGWKTPSGKIAALGVPCLGLLAVVVLPIFLLFAARATSIPEYSNERFIEYYRYYPLDSLEGILMHDAVIEISPDGNRSLLIQTDSPDKTVFRLFETGPIEKEDRMLIYSAKLRTENLKGKAYLEMWCDFPGKGEFFSRGLENPVTGTTEWTNVQTPFRLETGQMPANVKLNLVIEGLGTVWIDDIRLLLGPLD